MFELLDNSLGTRLRGEKRREKNSGRRLDKHFRPTVVESFPLFLFLFLLLSLVCHAPVKIGKFSPRGSSGKLDKAGEQVVVFVSTVLANYTTQLARNEVGSDLA